jgi:hypothetical protein
MSPCYKGHKNSSVGAQRDLNQQEHNQTPKFEGFGRKGGIGEI